MQASPARHPLAITLLLAMGGLMALATVAQSSWLAIGFASFLPQADTWQHVDALVKSPQGLDITWLFERHNGVHLLVIPKLIYHLDVVLTGGNGTLVAISSLVFLLMTPLLVSMVIWRQQCFNPMEKITFILIGWILLASPMQAESLLNPANLQWSVFTFTITLTAFCLSAYLNAPTPGKALLTGLALLLNAMTSASVWLTALPVVALLLARRYGLRRVLVASISTGLLAAGVIAFISGQPLFYISNFLHFFAQYFSPFASKISFTPASYLASITGFTLYLACLSILYRQQQFDSFFLYLLTTLLFIALATALVRSFMGNGFTFRFINLPLLCLFSVIVILYIQLRNVIPIVLVVVAGLILTSTVFWLNICDTRDTMHFRNHLRLTPVAYALEIQHPPLVEELPGYDTGSFNYEDVMTEKDKLKVSGVGIYHSSLYSRVGKNIHLDNVWEPVDCQYDIELVTRLNDQPAYAIDGSSYNNEGKVMDQVWITDLNDIVIGIGLPVVHRRTLSSAFFDDKTWTAYLNPSLGTPASTIQIYAYDDMNICQPFSINLPVSP